MLLTVVTSSDDTEVEIRLRGELDHSNADVLRQHVLSALARLPRQVVIDMSELTFMDSAGIGEIIRANRLLTSRDRGLVIRGANEAVTRLLEMMGIHLIVRLEPAQEALTPPLELTLGSRHAAAASPAGTAAGCPRPGSGLQPPFHLGRVPAGQLVEVALPLPDDRVEDLGGGRLLQLPQADPPGVAQRLVVERVRLRQRRDRDGHAGARTGGWQGRAGSTVDRRASAARRRPG